jgi:NAD(P)-dependent dehydrogenase (short-subunit alcohol dehydrogenase family)
VALRKATVLITGGAGSLGSALALCCGRAGFETVLLDKDRRGLESLSDRLAEQGLPEPLLHPLDLSTAGPDDLQEMIDAIVRECGGIDALVHCAVYFQGLAPLEHVPPQEWLLHLQVNLNAAWLLSALCLPQLRKSGAGRLYFLLEDLQRVGGPQWGPYGVSKHALHALVGQLAAECAGSGVQVLGINPGPMRSPLRSKVYLAEHPAAQPEPTVAADRILELLSGRRTPSGVYVDLGAPHAAMRE